VDGGHAMMRGRLGRVGLRTNALGRVGLGEAQEAVVEIEELGFGALWYSDAPELFSLSTLVLSWTASLVACSSIATIYSRDPLVAENGANFLSQSFDGRFLLGLGVSHRRMVEAKGLTYHPPLAAMAEYLDAMDAAAQHRLSAPRILAALAPAMVRLAGTRSLGAHPYFTPTEHTESARELLGPEPLLCVELSFVLTGDRAEAREIAGRYWATHLGLEAYRKNLLRLGIPEDELDTDATFDRIVAWGDAAAVQAHVRAHLDAGADHVCVQPLPTDQLRLAEVRELAPALRELR
jgi:probable F420-dependent oxidoreductase